MFPVVERLGVLAGICLGAAIFIAEDVLLEEVEDLVEPIDLGVIDDSQLYCI